MVAIALVPLRDEIDNANLALILVLVVVVVASLGGRSAGAVAAVTSTLAFDFFLTRPFLSARVESADDIETLLILLAVGLLVGELASRARHARRDQELAAAAVQRVHRVADAVAHGEPLTVVLDSVQTELTALFGLWDCWLELPPFLWVIPRMDRGGTVEGRRPRMARCRLRPAARRRRAPGGRPWRRRRPPGAARGPGHRGVARPARGGGGPRRPAGRGDGRGRRRTRSLPSRSARTRDAERAPVSDAHRRAPGGKLPAGEVQSMLGVLKRLFVGRPLATTQMEEQRLSKTIALAVFSSDALSSTAYATEEILFVTALGASSLALGLSKLVPIAIVVVRPARDRDRLVPPGDLRLPQRRRRVRREQGEHRRDTRV